MKTGLIFDMDGTLWDSSENVAFSWNEKLNELGYSDFVITKQDIMSVMGLTMKNIADIIFRGLPENKRMELLSACCIHENEYLSVHGGVLYPHLEETLVTLNKKYSLCIVSNCQSGYIEAFLKYYKFEKYFDDIECYGNNLKEKGDNIALVSYRNHLDKAIYIGDTQGDMDSAVKAGALFIHASYGFGKIKEDVPELAKFSDLPELLDKIGNFQ